MRLRAASELVLTFVRLSTAWVRRFEIAPNVARWEDTLPMTTSISVTDLLALPRAVATVAPVMTLEARPDSAPVSFLKLPKVVDSV